MKSLTYEEIIQKLEASEAFAFSRWGDGEFNCIFGKEGHNCDKHQYFDNLRMNLIEVIKANPDYYMGMAQHEGMKPTRIWEWLKKHKIKRRWERTDQFVQASKNNELELLTIALRDKRVCLIGKEELHVINKDFSYIGISSLNCWLDYDSILKLAKAALKTHDVLLFCSGMMSNVLIHHLHEYDPTKTYIDLGSVLDVYVGLNTRGYHKEIDGKL